jgi:enamine deaminase RidA (YjgF/YER057c/UK114 family)
VEDQVELALEGARRELETAGSTLNNVVKTFFLLTDLTDYAAVRKTETEYYERHAPLLVTTPPAATLMVVPSLGDPELRVQYEVIAAHDRADVTYHPEYWGGKELAYPHVPKEHAKFARSQAIGDLLVVSGCQALDHDTVRVETDDFAEQTRVVLDKVRVAVEEPGGSLADIAKTNVFVKDVSALATYRQVEREFLGVHSPASSVFVVSELPRPEFLVEVEAFALPDGAGEGLVFVSACAGPDLRTTFEILDDALAAAGSSADAVVKLTVTYLDAADYPEVERALGERAGAKSFFQVAAIESAGARFQADAVATVHSETAQVASRSAGVLP